LGHWTGVEVRTRFDEEFRGKIEGWSQLERNFFARNYEQGTESSRVQLNSRWQASEFLIP
jgi:hypothetical protein